MVEGESAALSAIHASRAELKNLRKILENEADVAKCHDKDAYSSINEKFHLGIARTSGNIYIQNYCRHMLWRSNLYIYFFDAFYHHRDKEKLLNQESPGQHKMILAAIEKNDPEMAKEAMQDHIKFQFRNLLPIR
jgi:DNA-binding GntR family transcriptional regulator